MILRLVVSRTRAGHIQVLLNLFASTQFEASIYAQTAYYVDLGLRNSNNIKAPRQCRLSSKNSLKKKRDAGFFNKTLIWRENYKMCVRPWWYDDCDGDESCDCDCDCDGDEGCDGDN